MSSDNDKLKQKFLKLPKDKQQRLCDSMGEMFTKLKADWESKPENAGKTVTYSELWDEYAKTMKQDKQ